MLSAALVAAVLSLGVLPARSSPIVEVHTEVVLSDSNPALAGNKIHCNLSPSIDINAILADFDTMAQHSSGGLCGGVVAPQLTIGGRKSAQASADGVTKFYVCNNAKEARCISLGADKRKLLENVWRTQCNGKAFWIQEDDEWSYGVDDIGTKECGF